MQSEIEAACIGINHLAERLGLSRRTIHRILARGELPSLQIGGRRLIRLTDVRRWLVGCEMSTHATAHPSRSRGRSVARPMMTIFHTSNRPFAGGQAFVPFCVSARSERGSSSSLVVKRRGGWGELAQTAVKHGMSAPEVTRLSEGTHAIGRRGGSVFVTIEARPDEPEAVIRELSDKVKNHVRTFQKRRGGPAYYVEVLEPRPRLHVHLVAAAPRGHLRGLIRSLKASAVFGDRVKARRVYDMPRLDGVSLQIRLAAGALRKRQRLLARAWIAPHGGRQGSAQP